MIFWRGPIWSGRLAAFGFVQVCSDLFRVVQGVFGVGGCAWGGGHCFALSFFGGYGSTVGGSWHAGSCAGRNPPISTHQNHSPKKIHPSPLPGGRLGGGWEAPSVHQRPSGRPHFSKAYPHSRHSCVGRNPRTLFRHPCAPSRHSCAGRNDAGGSGRRRCSGVFFFGVFGGDSGGLPIWSRRSAMFGFVRVCSDLFRVVQVCSGLTVASFVNLRQGLVAGGKRVVDGGGVWGGHGSALLF